MFTYCGEHTKVEIFFFLSIKLHFCSLSIFISLCPLTSICDSLNKPGFYSYYPFRLDLESSLALGLNCRSVLSQGLIRKCHHYLSHYCHTKSSCMQHQHSGFAVLTVYWRAIRSVLHCAKMLYKASYLPLLHL